MLHPIICIIGKIIMTGILVCYFIYGATSYLITGNSSINKKAFELICYLWDIQEENEKEL